MNPEVEAEDVEPAAVEAEEAEAEEAEPAEVEAEEVEPAEADAEEVVAEEAEPAEADAEEVEADEDDEDDDEDFAHYVGVLELVADHVEQAVFADLQPEVFDLDDDEEWSKLEQRVSEAIEAVRVSGNIPDEYETSLLTQDMLYEFTGLGPVEYFLADDSVTEVLVNDYQQIFVTHNDTTDIVWKSYSSPMALSAVDQLAESVGLGEVNRPPVISGDLPDGTSFRILLPPIAPDGPILYIHESTDWNLHYSRALEGGTR